MNNIQNTNKGKFVVLYGINNIGKSTQAKLVVDNFIKNNKPAEYIKYAIYDLHPSGKIINQYLRENNPLQLSSREFQIIQAFNKTQYQNELEKKLESGINIIAEDYVGTSIAWGMGSDIDMNFLIELNSHLLKPDVEILLDGERFSEAIETNHRHENDIELTNKVRQAHIDLARKFNWHVLSANDKIENIHKTILKLI